MQIDRYEVQRMLGQGATGRVYLAHDPKLNRQVAIKMLAGGGVDPALRRRFRLEARAIAALKHPNIIELYDYSGEDATELYLVMEYVPGPSLYKLVSERGPMIEATALCIAHELALALEHAHNHQVVHRDLKPENVLLHRGRVVLTDFGVVKAIAAANPLGERNVSTRTQVLGTPGFMAPEQFDGHGIDCRTDIFALGAVLYNLTTGELPYRGPTVDAMFESLRTGRFADPRHYSPLLSPAFCDLLRTCLAMKSKDRIATAQLLRRQVLDVLSLHGVTEIREELVSYENNPEGYSGEQRERMIEVAVRDLKVALKDHDREQAKAVIKRLQALTPLDERMQDISGVTFDADNQPVLVREAVQPRRRWPYVASGLGAGLVAGIVLTAALSMLRLVPSVWLQWLERVGAAIRGALGLRGG